MSTDEQLHAYFDGELSTEESARVEKALGDDSRLAARLREVEAVDDALELLAGHEAPGDFTGRVLDEARLDGALDTLPGHDAPRGFTDRVVATARARARRGLLLRLSAPIAAAAAILLAVVLATRPDGASNSDRLLEDALEYTWEADVETFDSLSLTDLEDRILQELEAT